MPEAYISVGSNLDRERHIGEALRCLRTRCTDLRTSNVYESDAIGFEGPPFLNLVVALRTSDSIPQTVQVLQRIERACNRVPSQTLCSRNLDLDLLLFGQCVVDDGDRHIPHPDILRYAFVLRPLAELAGAVRHPLTGHTMARLWEEFDHPEQPLLKPYLMVGLTDRADAVNRCSDNELL